VQSIDLPMRQNERFMMDYLDRVVYVIKQKVPFVYTLLEKASSGLTSFLYRGGIRRAMEAGTLTGTVGGKQAVIRCLTVADSEPLTEMLERQPEEHLTYFHLHGFDRDSLRRILRRRSVMTYGLFVDNRLCAYALLKLFPTRKAYLGRLVSPEMAGKGLGKFLSRYLYWQAYLLGFQPCSTINKNNLASLKSHEAVRPFHVVSTLPNDFLLIRFELTESDKRAPLLDL